MLAAQAELAVAPLIQVSLEPTSSSFFLPPFKDKDYQPSDAAAAAKEAKVKNHKQWRGTPQRGEYRQGEPIDVANMHFDPSQIRVGLLILLQ